MSKYQSPINEYSLKVCLCRSKYLSQLKDMRTGEMRTGEMRTGEMPPIHCEPMRSPTPALGPNHPNSQCITSLFSLCQDMLMPQSIRKLSDIQECFFFRNERKVSAKSPWTPDSITHSCTRLRFYASNDQ